MCSSDKHSESENSRLSKNVKEGFRDKSIKIIKKNWIALLAILISIFAFLQSGLNIYFTHFHKSHKFTAVVLDYAVDNYGDRYSNVVLINDGTYYETLYNAKFVYSDNKDFRGQYIEKGLSKNFPIVLKPGERSLCLIEDESTPWRLPLLLDGKGRVNEDRKEAFSWIEKKEQPYILHYGILFDVIGESGKKHKTLSYVGSIPYRKEYGFAWPKSETNIVVNLLKPNFKNAGTIRSEGR